MRSRFAAAMVMVTASTAACGGSSFDESAARESAERRTGFSGDRLEAIVDEARVICEMKDDWFDAQVAHLTNPIDDVALNDVVSGCPRRFN